MSSGGVKCWLVFGELIAPPPPLLTPSAPAALAGLLDVKLFGVPPQPMPVRCGFASGVSKGGGGEEHQPEKTTPIPAGGHGARRKAASDGPPPHSR